MFIWRYMGYSVGLFVQLGGVRGHIGHILCMESVARTEDGDVCSIRVCWTASRPCIQQAGANPNFPSTIPLRLTRTKHAPIAPSGSAASIDAVRPVATPNACSSGNAI